MDPNQNVDSSFEEKQQENDRIARGNRRGRTRFSDADSGSKDRSRERRNCRIYVSNIPYDYRWQELKDLFRRMVGNVEYVELFKDENNQPRGCGIIEFKDPENVQKSLQTMDRYEIGGREIVVKEDHGEKRDQYGRIVKDGHRGSGGGGGGGDMREHRDKERSGRNMGFDNGSNDYDNSPYDTYGLSKSFLDNLGINGPLHYKIFVANLDYKVDKKKLKEVFKLAGRVQNVELAVDKDGNSRGFAVIEYDHPVEAVQAISMFDRQLLYDRRITVRLDRIPDKGENIKLPEGLHAVGMGLGANGEPLRNVARNLANMNQQNMQKQNNMQPPNSMDMPMPNTSLNQAASILSAVTGQSNANVLGGLSAPNLSALTNALDGVKNLSVLSNPLLASSLSNLGLLTANQSNPMQENAIPPAPESSMQNNYSTSSYSTSSGFNTNSAPNYNTDKTVRPEQSFNNMMDKNNFPNSYGATTSQIGGRKSDTIVIKNIPLSCTWQTLRDKFRDIGEVRFAEIRGNNVGVVRFFKENDAELAIKLMDGSRMEGRTISVSYF
ncbi:myelin expression factor 2 [Condylostylus longicornis]|uniref:myelin expression factor 2 n=1 Tax=Condylostylus longicornis TaxID=2530218 RepID=UPI00244D9BA4|nr:myelin expression factor 2 [Condylostylus longicornis]